MDISKRGKETSLAPPFPPGESGFDSRRKIFVVGLSEQRPVLGKRVSFSSCPVG